MSMRPHINGEPLDFPLNITTVNSFAFVGTGTRPFDNRVIEHKRTPASPELPAFRTLDN